MGVSCSADRNIKAKINREGIWIEKLEHNPGQYIPEELRKAGEGEAVKVDLNRPMKEILAQLSQYPYPPACRSPAPLSWVAILHTPS